MSNPQDQAAVQPVQEAANNEPAKQEKKLEGEELKEAVRKQIEFYFSPQNLANDAFLVSHMSKDHYVGLDLISSFKILKALTTDPEVIKKAILDSKVLQLDETGTRVKPITVAAQQRTTIIIRDIEATLEELTALFPDSYKPKQIKPDIAFTWYVIYDDEASTMRAFDFLRTVTFKDEPIRARIKSENIIKSTVSNSAKSVPPAAVGGRQGNSGAPFYWDPSQGPAAASGFYPDPFRGGAFRGGRGGNSFRGGRGGRRGGKDGALSSAAGNNSSLGAPSASSGNNSRRRDNSPPPSSNGGDRNKNRDNFAQGAPRGGRKSRRNSDFEKRHLPNQPLPNFNNKSAFPLLPSLSKYEAQSSGYEGEFILYAKQTVIDVFNKQVNSLQKPADLPANCTAVLSSPITSMELTKLLPTIAAVASVATVESTGSEQQQQQQDAAATVAVPVANVSVAESSVAAAQTGGEQVQNSNAHIQIPNKSFAEVAITAKDIKTPEYKKPRNNSFSKKNEEKKERPQSASNKQEKNAANANANANNASQQSQAEKPKQERREKGGNNKQQQQHGERPKSGGNQQQQRGGNDKQHGSNKKKQDKEQQAHHNEKPQKKQKEQQQAQQPQAEKQQEAPQQQQESSSTSWAAVVTKKPSKEEQQAAVAPQQAAPAEKKD